MKVFIVESVELYEGYVDTNVKCFNTLEKALTYKQELIDNASHFIEDIQRDIDDGNVDSIITNNERDFWCYDSVNFDEYRINIFEEDLKND